MTTVVHPDVAPSINGLLSRTADQEVTSSFYCSLPLRPIDARGEVRAFRYRVAGARQRLIHLCYTRITAVADLGDFVIQPAPFLFVDPSVVGVSVAGMKDMLCRLLDSILEFRRRLSNMDCELGILKEGLELPADVEVALDVFAKAFRETRTA
ncbi:MAG: hypothetical protein ACRD1Z_07365 [Vicinamibacteria bacterium]